MNNNGELQVTLGKLKRYCEGHGGYDLELHDNNIVLSFVPSFPEAQEKGDSAHPPPRIIMSGMVEGGKVHFRKIEREDENGITEKDIEDAKIAYHGWLQFIEDNYSQ